MIVSISAIVPTVYQRNSLTHFGLPISKNPDGSFGICYSFKTKKEAKEYLINRAEIYFENEKDLNKAIKEIKKYNRLQLDAATANINKVENLEF
jgi:hypothetical protein